MCVCKDLRRKFCYFTVLGLGAVAADSALPVGVALRVRVGQVGGSVG